MITCYRLEKALKACALFREYSACSICCFCNKKSKTKERIKKQTGGRQSSHSSTRIRTSIWRSCPNQRVAHEHYKNVFIHLMCVCACKSNTLSQTPSQTLRLHSEKIRQNRLPSWRLHSSSERRRINTVRVTQSGSELCILSSFLTRLCSLETGWVAVVVRSLSQVWLLWPHGL